MWYNEYYLPWYNWFYGITPEKEKPEYINLAQLETEQEKVEIIDLQNTDVLDCIPENPPPSPEKKVEEELPPPKSDPIRIQPKRRWKRHY